MNDALKIEPAAGFLPSTKRLLVPVGLVETAVSATPLPVP